MSVDQRASRNNAHIDQVRFCCYGACEVRRADTIRVGWTAKTDLHAIAVADVIESFSAKASGANIVDFHSSAALAASRSQERNRISKDSERNEAIFCIRRRKWNPVD